MRHERRTCARLCHLAGGVSRLQAETQPSSERQPWTGRHLTRSSRPTRRLLDNLVTRTRRPAFVQDYVRHGRTYRQQLHCHFFGAHCQLTTFTETLDSPHLPSFSNYANEQRTEQAQENVLQDSRLLDSTRLELESNRAHHRQGAARRDTTSQKVTRSLEIVPVKQITNIYL